jgi:oligosaccharide repeat unit polymerase
MNSFTTENNLYNKNFFSILLSFFFLLLGILSSFFFYIDFFYPVILSVALAVIVFFYCLNKFKQNQIGILSLYSIGVCFLPFIHIIPYVINTDYTTNPFVLGKGQFALYLYDKKIVELAAMIGASCALGIAFSISLVSKKRKFNFKDRSNSSDKLIKTMPLFIWFIWFLIGIIFFIEITPAGGTFFASSYTSQPEGYLDFTPAAFLASYIIIIFVILDSFFDQSYSRRRIKKIFCLLIFISFLFNLSTGTRELLPLIFGLILFFYFLKNSNIKNKLNKIRSNKKIYIFLFIFFILGQLIGYVRSGLVDGNFEDLIEKVNRYFGLEYMLLGTWSSALATVLSVAHDYIDNILKFSGGRDYYNLLISIPPGFIADYFGYERPFTQYAGPAYEMRYGVGGTHITILPFRNFGIFGVFFISATLFSMLLYFEKICFRRYTVINSVIIVTIVTIVPLFLWYGEKFAINTFIIIAIFSFFYRISLSLQKKVNQN